MTPGARESDALLVAMYEGTPRVVDGSTVRRFIRKARVPGGPIYQWATSLGFGALVTGDYGEADR